MFCLVAGVSVWYDLHGALHTGLETSRQVLAQHTPRVTQQNAQKTTGGHV